MEIDLNLAVCDEMEKNACSNGGECDRFSLSSSLTSSHPSNAAAASSFSCSLFAPSSSLSSSSSSLSSSSIYAELWHACAGPIPIMHKKGDLVVYFPQGHLEQANSPATPSPPSDLPPQILCRVEDVQLLANNETDEVYTQLSLHPMPQMVGVELEGNKKENVGVDEGGKSTSHMFCKTLTASDTSTHGGFSVPRRAAEDCFPPLHYKEERPSQELVATDLHGVEWKFRHIYRGQPRRHLLTTGWSVFVSRKILVSGDAVLFLRGEAGDLRLGIRRAARPRNDLPDSVMKTQNHYPNVLSHVANAVLSNGMFNVVCSPRASHSNFIVPYQKYLKSTASPIPVGMRFKMKYDLDDSPERRFGGVVTGVSDADPYRWPNSKWRHLMVRWDDKSDDQERVSPWDIDPSSSYAPLIFQPLPRLKRLRSDLPNGLVPEHVRSSKVLQSQENEGRARPARLPIVKRSDGEFVESNWFPKVLQGQEICGYEVQTPSFYPLASEGVRSWPFPPRVGPVIFGAPRTTASAAAKSMSNENHLVGRAINLHGRDSLLLELERLFSMQRAR